VALISKLDVVDKFTKALRIDLIDHCKVACSLGESLYACLKVPLHELLNLVCGMLKYVVMMSLMP
jgi:hypothetical protein